MASSESAIKGVNFSFHGRDGEDFHPYKKNIENYLAMKFGRKIITMLEGTTPVSRIKSTLPDEVFFFRALLGFTCKDAAGQLIEGCGLDDGMEAWGLLNAHYLKKGEKYVPGLLQQLTELKYANPIQLQHDVLQLIKVLGECGFPVTNSKEIPEVVVKTLILQKIVGEEYGAFYFAAMDKTDQSLKDMFADLTNFHKSLEVRNAAGSEVSAMSFTADRGRGRGRGRGGRGNGRGNGRGGGNGGGNGRGRL